MADPKKKKESKAPAKKGTPTIPYKDPKQFVQTQLGRLFDAYGVDDISKRRDSKQYFRSDGGKSSAAFYVPEENAIAVGPAAGKSKPKLAFDTIGHELNHRVQDVAEETGGPVLDALDSLQRANAAIYMQAPMREYRSPAFGDMDIGQYLSYYNPHYAGPSEGVYAENEAEFGNNQTMMAARYPSLWGDWASMPLDASAIIGQAQAAAPSFSQYYPDTDEIATAFNRVAEMDRSTLDSKLRNMKDGVSERHMADTALDDLFSAPANPQTMQGPDITEAQQTAINMAKLKQKLLGLALQQINQPQRR